MLYNNKYKGGLLLFIKKNIRHDFTEVNFIPNNRGISLMSDKIDERYNTFIHFIYGPAKTTEANTFWIETEKNISKKESNKNKHFIIGDLNVQLEKDQATKSI